MHMHARIKWLAGNAKGMVILRRMVPHSRSPHVTAQNAGVMITKQKIAHTNGVASVKTVHTG